MVKGEILECQSLHNVLLKQREVSKSGFDNTKHNLTLYFLKQSKICNNYRELCLILA